MRVILLEEYPVSNPGWARRRQVLERLSTEAEHGAVLVDRALGYLACSRHGLAEDEVVDLLSAAFHTELR